MPSLGDTNGDLHRPLIQWNHPLFGTFEVQLDLWSGVRADLDLDVATIRFTAATGVWINTPGELPDVVVKSAEADLRAGTVRVVSEPALGEFEERLLSGLLADTLLKRIDPDGLVRGARHGLVELYAGPLVRVTVSERANVAVTLSREAVLLELSDPIELDFGALFGITPIKELRWDFAKGRLKAGLGERPRLWDKVVERVLPAIATRFITGVVPKAMLEPGYDPLADPELARNVRRTLARLAGAERVAVSGPVPGRPRVAVADGSGLALVRTFDGLELTSPGGVHLDTPGRPWTSALRLIRLRWSAASSAVEAQASHPIGPATLHGLHALLRERVVAPVVAFFATLERDQRARYRLPTPGAELRIPDAGARLAVLGPAIELELTEPLLVRGPLFFRYAATRARYVLGTGEAEVELCGTNLLAKLFGFLARPRIERGLATWLRDVLPKGVRANGYDVFADPNQHEVIADMLGT